jgi:hypothetical protein
MMPAFIIIGSRITPASDRELSEDSVERPSVVERHDRCEVDDRL